MSDRRQIFEDSEFRIATDEDEAGVHIMTTREKPHSVTIPRAALRTLIMDLEAREMKHG